ncbi:hypothetical protein ACQKE0_16075 [Shewanella colwelliana]|uniref:hypothetical protein n=1 Tax=Shewanella colwelliana TaxID=23 RepID=UPI003CFDBED1
MEWVADACAWQIDLRQWRYGIVRVSSSAVKLYQGLCHEASPELSNTNLRIVFDSAVVGP